MVIYSLLFHLFAVYMVVTSFMVITSRNPVHSVLWLIATFFSAAGLFVLLGAEFIAMVLVIVYVGAVAILFLFVVMMLDINLEKLKTGFKKNIVFGVMLAGLLFSDLFLVINSSAITANKTIELITPEIANTKQIGAVLYTDYVIHFQLAGIILLVAMIGAIALTFSHNKQVKRQIPSKQLDRNKMKGIRLVKARSGEGVDV